MVDRNDIPGEFFVLGAHGTFGIDVPACDRVEGKLHLLGEVIFVFLIDTAIFQLGDFHTFKPMSVRIFDGAGRPTACDIVEEEPRKVLGLFEIGTRPFDGVFQSCPLSQLGREFTVHGVAVQLVVSVADETVLVEDTPADRPVELFRSSAQAEVVLGRRNVFLIKLAEPVSVGKCAGIVFPFSAFGIGYCAVIFGFGGVCVFATQEFLYPFHGFLVELIRTSGINGSPVEV